jgi:HEAT repeat protein
VLINLLEELPLDQGRQVEEFLMDLAGEHAPKVTLEADAEARKKCREVWMAWWETPPANLTNDTLFLELHRRTLKEENRPKVKAAIALLGAEDFAVREKGSADLKTLGEVALPELRVAAAGTDPEIARRAKELLDEFEKDHLPPLPSSSLRLLTLRRPSGLMEAILGYLPFADDDTTRADAQLTLNNLAALQEHADPLLLRHLEDRAPLRRAAAAQALLQCVDVQPRPTIRKLLADPDIAVRIQVGLALAAQRDREAIPVLISALADATEQQSNEIEEYLRWLSADHGPADLPPNTKGNRRRDHWAAWWEANARLVNLPEKPLVLPTQTLGYTLLVSYNMSQICELDAKGKTRWTMNNVGNPMDAQVLPGDRVLVSEFGARRVTERNLKGDVVWQRAVNGNPISAQRLSNGNTFIVTPNQLLEVDRAGKEVMKIDRPQMDVFSARRLNDGKIMVLSNTAQYQRLDRRGKELTRCMIPNGLSQYANEILPSGNVLIPMTWQNQVMEYTSEGKLVNTFNVQMPSCACRLPRGNTLVGMQNVIPARVVELDPKGKQVGELKSIDNNLNNMMVTRIHRR